MKSIIIAAIIGLGSIANAQDAAPVFNPSAPTGVMTLGGIPQLIADKLKETKPAGIVDFSGRIGGGAYLPWLTFHDKNGTPYVEAFSVGYRALQGQKPSGLFIPVALNFPALSARAWNFAWAQDHVTRSIFPDSFFGVAPIVPIDAAQLKTLRLDDPKQWLCVVGSVRFK